MLDLPHQGPACCIVLRHRENKQANRAIEQNGSSFRRPGTKSVSVLTMRLTLCLPRRSVHIRVARYHTLLACTFPVRETPLIANRHPDGYNFLDTTSNLLIVENE